MTKTNGGGRPARTVVLLLGVVASWLAFEGRADAQPGRALKIDGVRPEIHLSLGPGFGTGFLLEIPLVQDGWLQSREVTDEFVLAPGFEFYFVDFDDHCHSGHGRGRHCHGSAGFEPAFGPNLSVIWNVYLNEEWSVFPQLGFTLMFARDDWVYHHHHQGGYGVFFDPVIGAGARWHFAERNALVMRLVYPFGFQFGITF